MWWTIPAGVVRVIVSRQPDSQLRLLNYTQQYATDVQNIRCNYTFSMWHRRSTSTNWSENMFKWQWFQCICWQTESFGVHSFYCTHDSCKTLYFLRRTNLARNERTRNAGRKYENKYKYKSLTTNNGNPSGIACVRDRRSKIKWTKKKNYKTIRMASASSGLYSMYVRILLCTFT